MHRNQVELLFCSLNSNFPEFHWVLYGGSSNISCNHQLYLLNSINELRLVGLYPHQVVNYLKILEFIEGYCLLFSIPLSYAANITEGLEDLKRGCNATTV